MLKSTALVLGFIAALGTPAIAMNSITNVPTFWPAEGAFDKGAVSASISTKGIEAPAPSEQSQDR